MKSFISTGSPALAARGIQAVDPRKYSGSVTTEIAAAPPRAYSAAIFSTSQSSTIAPADGDAALISAMSLIGSPRSAAENANGLLKRSGRGAGGASRRRARLLATMSSRKLNLSSRAERGIPRYLPSGSLAVCAARDDRSSRQLLRNIDQFFELFSRASAADRFTRQRDTVADGRRFACD